jgi:hypothetical protein
MRRFGIFGLLVLAVACNSRDDEQNISRIGNSTSALRQRDNSVLGITSSTVSDPYGPTYLAFPVEELRAQIPSFEVDVEGVRYDFDVEVWPDDNLDQDLLLDSYRLRGRFEGATVSYDPRLRGYRVNERYSTSDWDLLSVPPSRAGPPPTNFREVRIADCHRPPGFQHHMCTLSLSVRGHNVYIRIADANMHLRDDIITFVREKLEQAYRGPRQ